MTTKVFISYRRDDSAGHAGRVHDRLEREFGRDLLFMDVDAIPLGADFVDVLGAEVAKCDVLLAIIGPNWLNAKDASGKRRLEDENDFVRIEIAQALQRGIPVIPILLDGTSVPSSEQLPADMKSLSRRNGLDVRHASFHADMDKLVRSLQDERSDRIPAPVAPPPTSNHAPSATQTTSQTRPASLPAILPTTAQPLVGIEIWILHSKQRKADADKAIASLKAFGAIDIHTIDVTDNAAALGLDSILFYPKNFEASLIVNALEPFVTTLKLVEGGEKKTAPAVPH